MKVLHLIKTFGAGGAEVLLTQVALSGARTFDCLIGFFYDYTSEKQRSALTNSGTKTFKFNSFPGPAILLSVVSVARLAKRENAGLIHCHLPITGVLGRIVGWMLSIPVIYTEHNLQSHYNPLTRTANRLTWKMQDVVIAVSDAVAESIKENSPTGVDVRVLKNCIDTNRFSFSPEYRAAESLRIRQRYGFSEQDFVVIAVAIFSEQKRLDLWLLACSQVAQKVSNARFLLVGDGNQRDMLETRARELNILSRTAFAGMVDDPAPFYAAADCMLISSDFEGLPLCLLEALAASLPVVSTAVGGIPEVLVNEDTGFLVATGDVQMMTERVVQLYQDPQIAAQIGLKGRALVNAKYGIDSYVSALQKIYGEVTGKSAD